MSVAPVLAFVLVCLLNNAAGSAEIAAPHHVHVVSLNTNYTLSWEWNQSVAGSHAVTFTAAYVARFKLKSKKKPVNWTVVCSNTSRTSCDLTRLDLHYLSIYVVRVQASLNGRHSDWVQMEFCPDKDADLGPPSKVGLTPAGSTLDVNIVEPLTSANGSMKELVRELYYHIVYWEGSLDKRASGVESLNSISNLVTLPDLKPWTWYCVAVQSRADFYNKSSSFTPPHCRQTEGVTPWWLIFLYFVGSLLVCFTIVLVLLCVFYRTYKTAKSTFFPSSQLPTHFKQYLCDSPGSDIPRLLSPDSESELLCDKVIICPVPVLEIHQPPPEVLEPESRHSRQDSSGSGDSGVYSTGGSSGLRQPSSTQTSGGTTASSWLGPVDSDQLKMRDMAAGLKSRSAITDEGVVDVCV